jgi:hypothetical protein
VKEAAAVGDGAKQVVPRTEIDLGAGLSGDEDLVVAGAGADDAVEVDDRHLVVAFAELDAQGDKPFTAPRVDDLVVPGAGAHIVPVLEAGDHVVAAADDDVLRAGAADPVIGHGADDGWSPTPTDPLHNRRPFTGHAGYPQRSCANCCSASQRGARRARAESQAGGAECDVDVLPVDTKERRAARRIAAK